MCYARSWRCRGTRAACLNTQPIPDGPCRTDRRACNSDDDIARFFCIPPCFSTFTPRGHPASTVPGPWAPRPGPCGLVRIPGVSNAPRPRCERGPLKGAPGRGKIRCPENNWAPAFAGVCMYLYAGACRCARARVVDRPRFAPLRGAPRAGGKIKVVRARRYRDPGTRRRKSLGGILRRRGFDCTAAPRRGCRRRQ